MFASFLSTIFGSLLSICVTALAAFAVTLIFRTSTTTNFAQGSIAAFGCYIVADLLNKYGMPVWQGVFIGMVAGVLIGLVIDLVIFRNGRHVNAIGKQIITMGIVSLFFGGIPLVFGTPERIPFEAFYNTVKAGVSPNISIAAFGGSIVITKHALICLAISVVVLGVLFLLLKYSKWGLGVRATASNEFTAELMGIDTRVITAVSWAVAGALGVLAAVMYAGGGTTISASFMTTIQGNAFLAGSGRIYFGNKPRGDVDSNGQGTANTVKGGGMYSALWDTDTYWLISNVSTSGIRSQLSLQIETNSLLATGPRDFVVEYSTDGTSWTAVPGGSYTVIGQCDSKNALPHYMPGFKVFDFALPAALQDKASVSIRLRCASLTGTDGKSSVVPNATNRLGHVSIKYNK